MERRTVGLPGHARAGLSIGASSDDDAHLGHDAREGSPAARLQGDEPADLGVYASALRSSWRPILLFTAVITAVAVGVSVSATPTYVATAQLAWTGSDAGSYADARRRAPLLAAEMSSPATYERAATKATGVSATELAAAIRVNVDVESASVAVSARGSDAALAADMANAAADAAVANDQERRAQGYVATRQRLLAELQKESEPAARVQISERLGQLAAEHAVGTTNLALIAAASPPTVAESPKPFRTGVLALLASLILAATFIAVREQVSPRARTRQQVGDSLGLPVIAELPSTGPAPAHLNSVWTRRQDETAAAYEGLQMLLDLRAPRRGTGLVLVAGIRPGESAAEVAAGLARALAGTGHSVLLVGADLWRRARPTEAVPSGPGFSDLLSGRARLDDVMRQPPYDSGGALTVLPSGTAGVGDRLLRRATLREFALAARQHGFDHVVLGGPSLLEQPAGAKLLASASDHVVLVTSRAPMPQSVAAAARQELDALPSQPLGLVFAPARRASSSQVKLRREDKERDASIGNG